MFYQGHVSPLLLGQQQCGVSPKSGSRVIFAQPRAAGATEQPKERLLQSPCHCGRHKPELGACLCAQMAPEGSEGQQLQPRQCPGEGLGLGHPGEGTELRAGLGHPGEETELRAGLGHPGEGTELSRDVQGCRDEQG